MVVDYPRLKHAGWGLPFGELHYLLAERYHRFNAIEKDWSTFHQDHQSIRRRRRNRFRHKACNEMYPGRT